MTKVIFRKEFPENGGGIIAVFPSKAGDSNPYRTCLCYAPVGQHSAMSLKYMKGTFPAQPSEYSDLYSELVSLGYDLDVCTRFSKKDLQSRKEQCK